MKTQIRPLLVILFALMLVTGVIYPLLVTGLAQLIFPFQANGSVIEQKDTAVGSELIGQNFSGMEYFWGRPSATSATPYNAFDQNTLTGSSGSNLGPLSQTLVNNVQERVSVLQEANPDSNSLIPIDLVTASGSGLDPEISASGAYYLIPRVAKARGISEVAITKLVDQYTKNRQFGLLGEPRVNVLMLNLALDGIK
jgi:K+-transporting ATPase ATPase C chain